MTDRLAELGALQWAVENLSTAGTNPNRLGLAGYIHAAYTDYQTWAAANPGVNPNRLSARGRLYGYFYDNGDPDAVITALFANNEQGVFFDPSDLSTMFQDSAGTTQVTADGQPVGLILDKSKGLALGAELVANPGPNFASTSGWAGNQCTLSVVSGKIRATATVVGYCSAYVNLTGLKPGAYYSVTAQYSATTMPGNITFSAYLSAPGSTPGSYIDATVGVPNTYLQSADADGSVWFVVYGIPTVIGQTIDVDFMSVKELPGNHASQATAAKRPVLQQDGNGKYYLAFDGVDDSLSTAAIDFTATDKMSVFSGMTVLGTSLFGSLYGNGVANDAGTQGKFAMYAPGASATNARMDLGGVSANNQIAFPFSTGTALVVAQLIDTSTSPYQKGRKNGVQVAQSTTDVGGQNFANAQFKVGDLAWLGGVSNFNGRIYALIVLGRLATTQEITDTETWVASKTGVTLP